MNDDVIQTLDGNAIAGQLYDVFGAEMTAAGAVCGSCGARRQLAELEVYLRGPGTIARCRTCKALLIALVTVRGVTCVDLLGLAAIES